MGWNLVKLVTAFTIGHSVTLALAVLGVVHVPVPPVEASIALSIAFVAREAIRREGTLRHGVLLVFAFGLLHGLGFASALAASGIARGELLLGLLTFNVGVEFGQLAFVLAVAGVIWIVRRAPRRDVWRPVSAYALGVMGFFWVTERVIGMLG